MQRKRWSQAASRRGLKAEVSPTIWGAFSPLTLGPIVWLLLSLHVPLPILWAAFIVLPILSVLLICDSGQNPIDFSVSLFYFLPGEIPKGSSRHCSLVTLAFQEPCQKNSLQMCPKQPEGWACPTSAQLLVCWRMTWAPYSQLKQGLGVRGVL